MPRSPKRGARRGMGELEGQVMDVLWDTDARLTPTEVGERISSSGELAYTTIMTVLTRLFEKGVLTRERRGRAWAYAPVVGRDEHVAQRMDDILRNTGDQTAALARFVDRMTPSERARLQRLLESRKAK